MDDANRRQDLVETMVHSVGDCCMGDRIICGSEVREVGLIVELGLLIIMSYLSTYDTPSESMDYAMLDGQTHTWRWNRYLVNARRSDTRRRNR